MGSLALTFSYQPPEFAKRCRIKINFDRHECTIVLKNVDKNDVGEWRIELEKVDLKKIERKVLFEESIILMHM